MRECTLNNFGTRNRILLQGVKFTNAFINENVVYSRGAFWSHDEAFHFPLQHEEIMMKTVGTIPYLGIFLNDLAMLHESAPDWAPRRKPAELRRPTSGTSLTSMAWDCRNNYNNLYDKRNQRYHSLEPFLTPPLLSTEPPGRSSRRKRVNESSDSGTGSACGDLSSQRPPFPVLIDHRSRKGSDNSVRHLTAVEWVQFWTYHCNLSRGHLKADCARIKWMSERIFHCFCYILRKKYWGFLTTDFSIYCPHC